MDLERARKLLREGNFTCVLVSGDMVLNSRERGVKPLMQWMEQNINLCGFSAADKVVGKATAYLYVKLGITRVYAPVMSRGAASVFDQFGVSYSADQFVDAILNRRHDGFCPMETAVWEIDDLNEALDAICDKYKQLNP